MFADALLTLHGDVVRFAKQALEIEKFAKIDFPVGFDQRKSSKDSHQRRDHRLPKSKRLEQGEVISASCPYFSLGGVSISIETL